MTDDIRPADTTPDEDAWLESLLRDEAAKRPYLDDDGFTQRLMAALPPPRKKRTHEWIVWAMAILGVLIGGIGLHGIEVFLQDLSRFVSWQTVPLDHFASLLILTGMFYWLSIDMALD